MKTLFLFLFILSAYLCSGQTQSEMTSDANGKYISADSALNVVYHQVLHMYAKDSTFIENLKATERLWIQMRNAELKLKYPDSDQKGSVQAMCTSLYLTDLTNERIKTMRVWLQGAQEGDACAGSAMIKKK